MARILYGPEAAASIDGSTAQKVEALKEKGITPTLAIVRVGEKEADLSYERGVTKRAAKVGIETRIITVPYTEETDAKNIAADTSAEEAPVSGVSVSEVSVSEAHVSEKPGPEKLASIIANLNADSSVHGILLFRPLPKNFDEDYIVNLIAPEKDVDGVTQKSAVGVYAGTGQGYPPCTPDAVVRILDHYGIPMEGKRAVIVGRSLVVGKPLAMMLLKRNATVTICHTKTQDMPSVTKEADILIAAAGHIGTVRKEHVAAGQTVIDVGINMDEDGKMKGDVSFEEVEPIVDAVTPVPKGVGSVTVSVLLSHTADAAAKQKNHQT